METRRVADILKYLQNKYAPGTHSDTKGNIFVNE